MTLQRKLGKLRATAQTPQSYAYLIVTVTSELLPTMSEFVQLFVFVLALPGGVRACVVYRVVELKVGNVRHRSVHSCKIISVNDILKTFQSIDIGLDNIAFLQKPLKLRMEIDNNSCINQARSIHREVVWKRLHRRISRNMGVTVRSWLLFLESAFSDNPGTNFIANKWKIM